MRIKRIICFLLCLYLFQVFLVPLVHYRHEIIENDECGQCYAGAQLNSSCGEHGIPCGNPAHHHHGKHKAHDPAQCAVCKTFLQDIEEQAVDQKIFFRHTYIALCCNKLNITFLLTTLFSSRSPPQQIS